MRKNLSLPALRAVVFVLLIAFGVGNAWASSNSTYYSKMNVAVASTGGGTVYVTSSGKTSDTKNSSASSAPTHTYNIYATANAGYKFTSWSGSGITFGSTTTANTTGAFSASSTKENNPTAKTATASFVAIQATAAPANVNIAAEDPSTTYPENTDERTLTFTTTSNNALTDFTYAPANGASGKFTFSNWRRVDATHVAVDYTFSGGGNYGGLTRTNQVSVTLKGVADITTKTCTITATFPNAKIMDGSADEVFATYKSTDATQEGVAKTAVFDVEYVDGTNNFDTPTFTGAGASHFAYNSMSYADGKLTVNYTYNGNKENGTHTATLTLKVNDAIGGTDATYGSKAITITAHNEEEATNDASVTPAGGSATEYATFAQALAAANGLTGSTLTLLRNVDLGTITATNNINKAMTIDLNGKELRAAVNKKQTAILTLNANVAVTIKDSKTGGKIINEHSFNGELYTFNVAKGTLNLESGTIAIHNTAQYCYGKSGYTDGTTNATSMVCRAIYQTAGTTINITGGRVEAKGTRTTMGILQASSKANTTTLNISGSGEVYAESPSGAYAIYAYGKVNISGGKVTARSNTETVNGNTGYTLYDDYTYHKYAHAIYMNVGLSPTAANNYFGTLTITGGEINSYGDYWTYTTNDKGVKAIYDTRIYGIYLNAAAYYVAVGGTAADGTKTQKASAIGSVENAKITVNNVSGYAYGIFVCGDYNSFDNTHTPFTIKNTQLDVTAWAYAYGVYANASIGSTSKSGTYNYSGCWAGNVELTGTDVTVTADTTQAFGLWAVSTATTLYENTALYNSRTNDLYGEYGSAAKIVVNSGNYTAKTNKGATAYAAGSSTRSRSVWGTTSATAAEKTLGGNAEAYAELIIHDGTFRATTGTTEARAISVGGNTTIDGGHFYANAGTTTARGIYAVSGKLTMSGVDVHSEANSTAYGIDLACGISDFTGFSYYVDAALNNLTVEATTRTGGEADAVIMEVTKRPLSETTYNAAKAADKTNYGSIYQYGEYAIGPKATINGGTYTAKSATSTAYGARMNSAAICEDVNGDGELAIGAAELNINNATFEVEAKTGSSAYGIWAGGPATIDNSTFTVKTSTSDAFGIRPRYGKTTISNSTIDVTAGTATARGVYVDALMSTISTSNNTTHYCGVQGFEIVGELESNNNIITATANNGNTAYGIQVISAKGQATQTTAEKGLAFKGDHACAGKATINGGKYTATASGTTAYAIVVSDPAAQGEVTATPECIVNDGKFYGYATGGTYADVSLAGETGYFVLNGGYYVKDENLDKKLGEGMNKVAVKSGTPEYTEGYRWRVTDNMTGEVVCKVYKGTTLQQSFQSLEEALQYVNLNASSSNQLVIVMCGNYTLSKGDYELPQYSTLLIPYKSSGTGKGATQAIGTSPEWTNITNAAYVAPTPLYKLTFESGVNMTVKGVIEASARTYLSNEGLTSIGNSVVTGNYGWLQLNEGARIDLESGARLQAWGYVTGKGEINAKNNSEIYEDFQLGDWRGGSNEVDIAGNTNGLNKKGVFVITHYFYQNVECPVTYRPGAKALAYGGAYMNYVGNTVTQTAVGIVGVSNAMFLMDPATAGEDTWVRKEYDAETDYLNWKMNSGAKLGTMSMNFNYVGDVNSTDYVLPITSNFNIIANSGEIIITSDVCFIPGSKLTIKKEATVTIQSGVNVFFYDQDDWASYSGYYFHTYYSPSWKMNPRIVGKDKTKNKQPDAWVQIEGLLNIQGAAYTTAGGANLFSTREHSGKVAFGKVAPASTSALSEFTTASGGANKTLCQLIGGVKYNGKALNSVWLKNEDGTFAQTVGTAANKTWIYMKDDEDGKYKWILSYDDGCFTYKNTGGGEHQLIHPSDWVAVGSVNANHAYPSEDATRMFVNAEAATTSASCVWWEVNPTPEVIDGTTYYVANNDYFDNFGTYYYWDNTSSYWKPKKITVTWQNEDGTKITNGTYGDLYSFNTSPQFFGTNPKKTPTAIEKYDWIGWRDAEGNIYDKNATLPRATSNVTYTAYFNTTKYQYTITFKNDDNSDLWAGLVDAGTTGAELQALFETKYNEKTGSTIPLKAPSVDKVYTFDSWNTALQEVTGAATYTATYTWVTRKYHVTFYSYDAVTVLYEADVNYNTNPVYPDDAVTPFRANTSAYSYNWTGWKQGATTYGKNATLPKVTGDISYTATFEQTELKYQVFFKRPDGTIIDAPFFNYEETPAAFPANPILASTVSTDYTFDHWEPAELVPVTEDGKVYTAFFSESTRQYTAHFVNYDGKTLNADQTIDYNTVPAYTGETPFHPNDNRNSYEFSGWAWEAGDGWSAGSISVGEAFPAIKGDITFTAQFNPVLLQFNVIFQREDGQQIQVLKKKWGESIPTTFPTAENYEDDTHCYTFTNWTPSTITTPVTADATYTAHYTQGPKVYSLTISVATASAGYGSVSPTSVTEIPHGTTVTKDDNTFTVNGTTVTATPAAQTAQYTYAFKQWNNVPNTVTANVTNITAEFTRTLNTYTVTFNDYNGTELKKQTVDWNTAATAPANPSREGYNFTGWDKAFDAVTADLVVTAQYSAKSYEITLHTNEGTINKGNVESYTYGVGATLPSDVTRANHLFEGWFDNSGFAGDAVTTISTTATGDKEFWAKWKLNNFDVTFDVQGHGTAPEAQSIVANGKVTKPADPSETGWTFNGWYKEAGCTNAWNFSSDEVTANTILYAKWTRTKYTIKWVVKLNGETEIEETEEVEHGVTPNYGPDPTKASDVQYDYSFTEWSPAPYAADKDQTYEGTFKATAHLYTITWVDEQVGVIETQQYRYGLTPDFTYNKPNSDGYTYTVTGWTPEIVAVTGDATYTAVYTARIAEKNVNTDETLSFDEDAEVTYVRASGSLNTNGHTLTTDNLILEADAMLNVSGEINGNVEATNVYFDLKLNTAARHWHAFGVPWDVNVTEHALMEVDADGNMIRTLVVGRDCEIVYYNGATRAAQGPGSHCWEYLKHYSEAGQPIEVMKPGKGYMIAFTSAVQTVRFTKADGADIFFAGTNSVVGGEGENGGWNALANPMAYHATLSAGPTVGYVHDGGEIGHDGYTPYNIDAKKYIVGKMVYVQAASDQTIVVNPAGDAGDMTTLAFAPKRRAKATDKQYLSLNDYYAVSLSNGDEASKVYVLPEENKADEYVIGHDLSQFSMSTKKPQIWVNRYDTKLALNTTAPIANVAEFSVSLYAPATGEYTITTTFVPDEDYTVYLTQDGEAIWNLSDAPYAITLNKGTAKGYGIRLSRKAPQIATGIDEAVVDAKGDTRKVVINDKVFIIRGNHVYSAEGQLVK